LLGAFAHLFVEWRRQAQLQSKIVQVIPARLSPRNLSVGHFVSPFLLGCTTSHRTDIQEKADIGEREGVCRVKYFSKVYSGNFPQMRRRAVAVFS
jgi:hypothetical protein